MAFRRTLTIFLVTLLLGCGPSGPTGAATTQTVGNAFATLPERVAFLERYVVFRRTYETLDFAVMYQNNNGGLVPGPSHWDVRLIATIPAAEIPVWIPPRVLVKSPPPDRAWLDTVPTALYLSGVTEWYVDGNRLPGFDRERRIVVYRHWTR